MERDKGGKGMARNCILDYADEDSQFNDELLKKYNEKYIKYLVENYKIDKDRLLKSLDYEGVTEEDIHYELRENIDRITFAENWQITANLELLMQYLNIKLSRGTKKRFKVKMSLDSNNLELEVDTLEQMLDKTMPIIEEHISLDTIQILKKYGKIPKDKNFDLSKTSIKDLFDIAKDDPWFLMNHDLAEAFILSHYKDYPTLSDEEYMDRIVLNIEELEEREKKGLPVGDYLMSY